MKLIRLALLLALFLSGGNLTAQLQFVAQAGALASGTSVWSESVETLDVNGDGWLDIIYTNGIGFDSAGGSLAPQLLINQAVPGSAVFVDETASRIPAGFIQQGKGITTCDVDNDGDEDIIFANAFLTQPRILINDGNGVFTDETAARFPTINLGSFGVGCGDLDGDGDIDLVFSDTGASQFGAGSTAKLFINNGSGVFSNEPSKMNASNKVGAMQVNIVDIDKDFDLDVIIDGKSSGQQLYINDGDANFTLMAAVLPAGGNSVYETDWCDLDNDGDIDGAYVSMSGFNEGIAHNTSTGGSLSFTGSTGFFSGNNGNDDNEVAFIDANNDGLLDVLVCSLAFVQEKLYINSGSMTTGSFLQQTSAFTSTSDSSLDLTIGDFDNDGDLDVATAQGESGNFQNRLFLNNGAADSQGPSILRVEEFSGLVGLENISAGKAVRAHIQDSSYDNGKIFIGANLTGTVQKGVFSSNFSIPMSSIGGGMFSADLSLPTPPDGLLEATVTYQVVATDRVGNVTTSASENFTVCGRQNYGPSTGVNDIAISLSNEPLAGAVTIVQITQAPPSSQGLLLASSAAGNFAGLGGRVLVNISNPVVFNVFTNAAGEFFLPAFLPPTLEFIGAPLSLQAFIPDPSKVAGFAMSDGLRILICGEIPDAPTISSISPTVQLPGLPVVIIGANFASGMVVLVDGQTVPAVLTNDTTATFTMPAGVACGSSLTVENFGPLTSNSVTINGNPVITSANPSSGTSAGGAILVISGQNFGSGTTVTIGGNSANILSSGASSIVCFTPPGAIGPATVLLTNPAGCTTTTTYTYF